MRDPERIQPFLALLGEFWMKNPDWRFGQVVMNLTRDSEGKIRDPWNWEEPQWIGAIGDFVDEKDLSLEELYDRTVAQLPFIVLETIGEDAVRKIVDDHFRELHPDG